MIFNTITGSNSGNVDKSYAVITAEYPEGSICTCKKIDSGSTNISYVAENRKGSWVFPVNLAGKWQVAIDSTAKLASKIVDITEYKQLALLKLYAKDYVLYPDFVQNVSSSSGNTIDLPVDIVGWTKIDTKGTTTSGYVRKGGAEDITATNNSRTAIVFSSSSSSDRRGFVSNERISIKGYSYLCLSGWTYAESEDCRFGLVSDKKCDDASFVRWEQFPLRVITNYIPGPIGTVKIPLNDLPNASYYVAFCNKSTDYDVITECWLE